MNADNKTKRIVMGVGLVATIIVALVIGSFLATTILSVITQNPLDNSGSPGQNEPPTSPNEGSLTVGAQIAQYMEELEDQIVFFWSYNNTWVNENLTNIYSQYIDGLLAGMNKTTNETIIALVHEPQADSATVDLRKVTILFEDFRTLIGDLSNTTDLSLQDVFPPTFMIDIAYSDNNSISLVYSAELSVLGVLNGTWQYDLYYEWGFDNTHWGVEFPYFQYDSNEMIFFQLTDSQKDQINLILENLEALVIAAIPPPIV